MPSRLSSVLVAALLAAGALAHPGARIASAAPARVSGPNHVHSILIMPNNSNVVLLGSHYRLLKSTDGGRHWKTLLKEMMLSMAVDPAHVNTIYGITLQSGLVKSNDGGTHWKHVTSGPKQGTVSGVSYDPASHTLLAFGNGIYRSTDGGGHWRFVLKGQNIYNAAFGAGKTGYAAGDNGLFLSRDAGVHWSSVRSVGNQPVLQVVAAGRTAYAAAAISLLKTADGGKTWKSLDSAPQGIEFLGISPSNPDEIFCEVAQHGFEVSYNGGKSWHSADRGIHDSKFSNSAIRVAPSSASVVYTGSWGVHFYASHNAGKSWSLASTLTR
jgi:photosystem II stability/assembly factor-like uncharacterized protein